MVERKHHSVTEVDSDCSEVVDIAGRETVVRLNFYVVMGFFAIIFAIVIGYLFSVNAARDNSDRLIRDRVIVLEGKFDVIAGGIGDIKSSMKDLSISFRDHEQRTAKK